MRGCINLLVPCQGLLRDKKFIRPMFDQQKSSHKILAIITSLYLTVFAKASVFEVVWGGIPACATQSGREPPTQTFPKKRPNNCVESSSWCGPRLLSGRHKSAPLTLVRTIHPDGPVGRRFSVVCSTASAA